MSVQSEAQLEHELIAQQLKELEQQSQNTDKVIDEFCQELGIDSPFVEVK